MPPWAATECARRGESWKQNWMTWYPCSASVAPADPPASPVPTTMIRWRRRFAGLTSEAPSRRASHRSAIGPAGAAASAIGAPTVWFSISAPSSWSSAGSSDQPGHDADRYRGEAGRDRHGDRRPGGTNRALTRRPVHAERLRGAPESVVDMHADERDRDEVDHVDPPDLKVGHHVVVRPAGPVVGIRDAEREVEQVPHDEQADDDAAPTHGPGRVR